MPVPEAGSQQEGRNGNTAPNRMLDPVHSSSGFIRTTVPFSGGKLRLLEEEEPPRNSGPPGSR